MFLLGDIHGDFNKVAYMAYDNSNLTVPRNIIQVGDFGAGFSKSFYEDMAYLNNVLKKHNTFLYVIRGNHDDPSYFNGDLKLSNLQLLPDYSVINIEDKNILCVGGAISIDRKSRVVNKSWWVDEVFNLNPEKYSNLRDIDIVITHTAPSFCYPVDFNQLVYNYAYYDKKLLRDLQFERNQLNQLYLNLIERNNIEYWFYGHFHTSNAEKIDQTWFHLLSINQTMEI